MEPRTSDTEPTDAMAIKLDAVLSDVESEMERDLVLAAAKATRLIESARDELSRYHEGRGLHLRGWAHFGTGEMAAALRDQLDAVDLLTKCEDEQGVGRCLHALGSMYDTIGEPAVAIEHFERAIEIQLRIGDTWGEARTRNGLAITMADGDQYDDAIAAFREVEDRFEEAGDDWWVLMACTNRCVTQLEQIQADVLEADIAKFLCRETLEECDSIIAAVGSMGEMGRSVEIYARQCRAGVLLELGQADESFAEVATALPMATRAGDVTIIVDLELVAARALEKLGQPETVIERLDRAEQLARTAGRDRHLTRTLEARADILEDRGDLAGALQAHRQFHEQKTRARQQAEEMRAKVIRSLLDTQQAEHALELARTEVENLEAIGRERRRMVSVIAHELRNPITTVLGLSSELSRNWADLGDEGEQLIGIIRDEAEDLADIVEDLLAAESLAQGSIQVECDL